MVAAVKFWDRIARRYSKRPVRNSEAYELTLERVRTYLRPEHSLLELGCGTGTTALKLRNLVNHVLAIDFAPTMIAIAEEKRVTAAAENIAFEVTSVETLEQKKVRFDRILGFNLLHLLREPAASFQKIHGLLKEDGLFISKTICLADGPWFLKVVLWVLQALGYVPKPVHVWSVKELDEMIEAAGFQIIETGAYPAHPPSRFVVAKKV